VREASRREMLEIAMVENLQREDLNPIEEAVAFKRMATEFDLSQDEIAKRVGKNRTTVANTMRLLGLPEEIQDLVSLGTLSNGHARALLALSSDGARLKCAKDIVKNGLSVRQAEQYGQHGSKKRSTPKKRAHPALGAWEDRLRIRYGTQVKIIGGTGRGRVEIHYFSEEDLERILQLSGAETQL
jgi:ParB family chromosome partitioning protein